MNDSLIHEDVIENRNDDVISKTYFSFVDDLLSSTFVCPAPVYMVGIVGMVKGRLNFVDIRLQLLLDPTSLAHYLVSRDDWRVCMAQPWFLL